MENKQQTPARRWRGPGLAAALLALALAAGAWRWWQGPQVELLAVVQRAFVQVVVASGRVETAHRVDLGAPITGTVRRVPVAEGQAVAAGQLLVELDAAELPAVQRQAELAVTQAQARQRQLGEVQRPVAEMALRQARATLDNARAALARCQALQAQGFIGQAALDEAGRAATLADAQWRAAQKQLDATAGTGSDAALAEANTANARAAAAAEQARAGYALIRAPVAGTLIGRNVEPGDVVQPGKVLMVLSPVGATELVAQIDEKNLRLLRVGQPALASADAYPTQRFAAELNYINPGVDAQRGAVEVRLRVPEPPPTLRQDMTVSVDIEVARRANALLVPTDALRDADGPTPWVLKLDGRVVRRQAVTLGLRSGGTCEVLAGLRDGDLVLSATGPAVAGVNDGARVQALTQAVPP